ncbi:MAG: helix-turn-helix transcriptional regulator [Azonexus sp.]|nr:helix-turn-helix transcriptional regulator [Azonexus sp.]
MKTLSELAQVLRQGLKEKGISQVSLGASAGLAKRTVTAVLSGTADYKVTTLLALLDRLGYEVAILPKAAADGLAPGTVPTAPVVKTRVQVARESNTVTDGGLVQHRDSHDR